MFEALVLLIWILAGAIYQSLVHKNYIDDWLPSWAYWMLAMPFVTMMVILTFLLQPLLKKPEE